MSVLRRAIGLETRSLESDLADAFPGDVTGTMGWQAGMVWGGSPPQSLGVQRSMQLSAVFACLRLLSEAIATLPLDTFTRLGGVRRPYRPRPDYLSFQPPYQSRIEYLSMLMLSLLTDGNAYVATPRDQMGVPTALIVLDPDCVTVSRVRGKVTYKVREVDLDPVWDLMHIKAMTLPGWITGLSPIAYARETIGLGLAAQSFGQSFFDNGATPSGVIELPDDPMAPGDKSGIKARRIAETWKQTHGGQSNAQKVAVLTGGATFNKVSVQPNDAQFLETRQFQVPDVARIFGVPPHLIADASNSTSWGSGLQEQNLAFGQFSLRPWMERIEDGHGRLLTTHGLPDVFVKLNLDALLRASLKDRYESYQLGINSRFLTINEARSLEDLPPVAWGNEPPPPPPGGTP